MSLRLIRQGLRFHNGRYFSIFNAVNKFPVSTHVHITGVSSYSSQFNLQNNFTRNFASSYNKNKKSETILDNKSKKDAIYDSLKTELLSKNRVTFTGVQEYLRLCLENQELNRDDTILLLNCLSYGLPNVAKVKKQEMTSKIWLKMPKNLMQDEQVILNYLKSCCLNGIKLDHDKFLVEIGIKPSENILEALLETIAETGNASATQKLIEEMKVRGLPLNESTYATMIRCYGIANDLNGVRSVTELMNSAKIDVTSKCNSQLIQAFLRNNEEEIAIKMIKEHGKLFKEQQLLQILTTVMLFCPKKEIIELTLKNFSSELIQDKEIYGPFKNICSELILHKKYDEVGTLISCLPIPAYTNVDDLDLYGDFAMQDMILNDAPLDAVMKFVKQLQIEKRNEMALRTVTGQALRYFSPIVNDLLEAWSKEEPLKAHYFWPLFIHNSTIDGEIGVFKTLELMKKFSVQVDHDTLTFYVMPQLAITLKNVEKGVKELEAVGINSKNLLTPLSVHLMFQQRFNETLHINALYPTKLDTRLLINPLVTAFNYAKSNDKIPLIAHLVKVFSDKKVDSKYDIAGHLFSILISNTKSKVENQKIMQLIGELSLHGVKISKIAAEMLQQHLADDMNDEQRKKYFSDFIDRKVSLPADELIESHIKHPRDMNLEELECHFAELESKRLNTRGVLRRLLQLNVREKRLERALEVKKHCDKEGVDLSPGMHAAIFDIYIKIGRPSEAATVLKRLMQKFPAFVIDEHKIIDYAALLAKNGDFDEAQRVLRMRASLTPIKGSDTVGKNIWNLLNNIATTAPTLKQLDQSENHTKTFFQFLVQNNYCTYQNSVLGPVIKEFLNKNDLKSAVNEYVTLAKSHRLTPLQRQLMTILVDVANRPELQDQYSVSKSDAQDMLQELIKATSAIHGHTNTNIAFIVSLAQAGTEKQLRKVLIDPNARFSPDVLKKQCEYLNSVGRLDALLKLAKCSRGLGHIHEQQIYNMILDTLIQNNDYDGALNLFDQLLSDDEFKISNEFTRNLANLLRRNNIELPTNVALHVKQ
uniref:CSON006467 protein n=1 Tax=Culicoides sonorensis TaxID=179676 RepID=A0A336MTM1_CULSO